MHYIQGVFKMYRKIIVGILFLLAMACIPVFAKQQSAKVKPAEKTVLICKDSSALEIAVDRILRDTLTKLGYTVNDVDLAKISKEKASSYTISIIFSAINPGDEVDPRIQEYIASKVDTTAKIYLYTVYGGVYKQKNQNVDATTQATKDLHPVLIAKHILRSLRPK
jgi:hypothetical protein